MKTKLLTILTLLVLCVTGAWADDFSAVPVATSDVSNGNTAGLAFTAAQASVSGGTMYMVNTGSTSRKYINISVGPSGDKRKAFNIDTNSEQYFKIVLDDALANGDVISADLYKNNVQLWLTSTASRPSSAPTTKLTPGDGATSSTWLAAKSYTVTTNDGICGESTFYIFRNSNTTNFTNFTITRAGGGGGKTALTGTWTPTSVSVAKDAAAPSAPTFAMSAGTAGTDFNITYSEVEDEDNIVTTNSSTGITAISTSTAGTATVRATVALTETGAESYTLATTTYDITITVSNIATLFSMESVTGPTGNITHQADPTDVQATFSTGGSATVYNGHGSKDAVMCNGYIDLNGSGGSYLHIVFPTKLKAGDIISATGHEKNGTGSISWKIGKTSSMSNKACPYTLTAEDALIGATELYIGKNSGAQIYTLTISGEAAASDLRVTSSKSVTIATGATSDIAYASSNSTGAITYTSSATGVATVNSDGRITGVAPGTAVITIEQASDGTIRAAATKVTVTVERARKDTEVTGEYILDTTNGSYSGKLYTSTDESVFLESSNNNFADGSNTYNDLKNSHFKHTSNMTITLPTNYPVSTVWFVGYRNGSGTTTITLKKVDGEAVSEQSGTLGGNDVIPTADCVGFELATAAEKSIDINIGNESRGYFILNPAAQDVTLTQVGTNYYASYYSVGEMTITGATAYIAELDEENLKLTLTECVGGVVPARTGVILIGNSASATATPSFTGAEKGQGDLIGIGQKAVAVANYFGDGSISAADKVFVLGVENSKAGMYKYTGTSLGVNKAYLYNETLASSGARSLDFEFSDETTAINGVGVEVVKTELKKFIDNGQVIIEKNSIKYNAAGQQVK